MRAASARGLALGAWAATAAGAAALLWVSVQGVDRTRGGVARYEARLAAALWEAARGVPESAPDIGGAPGAADAEEPGAAGQQLVATFLGDRAGILAPEPTPTSTTGAYAYERGSLVPAAWIEVRPRRPAGTGWPRVAALAALLGLLAMAGWAARLKNGATTPSAPATGDPPRYPVAGAALSAATLAATALPAARWADGQAKILAAHQSAQADQAAELLAAAPGASATTTHLMHHADASIGVPLAATATGAALLAALVLSLIPLAAKPRTLRRTVAAWGFLAPAALLLAVFTFGPLLFSFWLSLHEWHLVDPVRPFAGLGHYRALLANSDWWSAIGNTAVFTLHVPLAMALALGLALLTQGSTRALRWVRLALFLPSVTSVVAIAVVWKWLLDDSYGLVNRVLGVAGLGPVPWLASPGTALLALMAIAAWMVVGYQMVVFRAGLAAIPRDWHDAAKVDGAGAWRRFLHITLPGLRPTLFFVLVTSVIGSFQVFGLVYVMTEGGPLGSTDVAVYHIYREAWEFLRFGNAAAMSWFLFAVVFAATWLHFRLLERRSGGRAGHAHG